LALKWLERRGVGVGLGVAYFYRMGEQLFASAPEPKEFLKISGSHNDNFLESPNYGPGIQAFLANILK